MRPVVIVGLLGVLAVTPPVHGQGAGEAEKLFRKMERVLVLVKL